ncbi:5-(carboxyamino)imidazole ribonucleotide mutase [Companilactobacillus ginsenosidimutans]|uniref:N5-carboxyaminoimidazole ribonucleotide mutase n=1 Tax=Companilactobacillus ginsenosidimutans TaxID=1007676 RepID=A0A0H4QFF7_9LACO|nr:5-(carboxyamino)imidazole ribonucleotide mutase [Companilactobacillus ginsenosidimutans]AKP66687.1 N5-carboxyaminoimidazole ribonucleotide mutase [Companilactobacillus ginsenosidimutans]
MTDVAVIMGSISDLSTMQNTIDVLKELNVKYSVHVISAHRMPQEMIDFGTNAENAGYKVIIAGAGGAAHLPGMVAATTNIPVIGVPVESHALKGMDSLLSIVQMPGGVPVATMAIGKAGATNAALMATKICALNNSSYLESLKQYKETMRNNSLESGKQFG